MAHEILSNLLAGRSWNLSSVAYDGNMFTFTPGVLAMAQCSMPTPTANHIYYGGCWQKAPAGSSFPDRRFEWYKSDNAGELMVFAHMDATNNEWVLCSDRIQAPSSPTATWTWRNFTVNGTAECYRKDIFLVDLTETFGSGNEPSKAWLDENLRFITENYVSFTNARMTNMTIRRKLLMSLFSYAFPEEPTAYNLISTYTTSQTWTAPEDGYYQIEVFGSSGNGGSGQYYYYSRYVSFEGEIYPVQAIYAGTGGGGGGGGYSCSRIKMNKGDTIALVCGAVGSASSATINSSVESYSTLQVTSAAHGGNGTTPSSVSSNTSTAGTGGRGGIASGGNYANTNGGAGGAGVVKSSSSGVVGGTGGTAASGGNAGGTGGAGTHTSHDSRQTYSGKSGSAGFIKIYRGNTNKVA